MAELVLGDDAPPVDDDRRGEPLASILPAFSYPQDRFVATLDALVPVVVREYAAGLIAAYLGRHLATVEAASGDLAPYLAGWVAEPARVVTADRRAPVVGWDHAVGDAYRSFAAADAEHGRVAVCVAAHLGACGVPGAWTARLDAPVPVRWGDWLLPAADRLAVESDGRDAEVRYAGPDTGGTVRLRTRGGAWHAEGGAVPLLRVDAHGVDFSVLARGALTMRDYEDLLERAVTWVDPRMIGVFQRALELLAAFAPEYLPWIQRTVHQLFLLEPRPGKVESGSVEHYLGLVHLTAHGEPLPVAELLLHEASHQHMNVVAKLEPLDDDTDGRTYWSPAVETDRPVSKIVAAFHAFGNVLRFYRRCRELGLADVAECARQERLLGGWMDSLVPPLVDNPALTATGNGLCRPLMTELGLR